MHAQIATLFTTTLRSARLALPLALASSAASLAQAEPPLVGIFSGASEAAMAANTDAFVGKLQKLGYSDGENIRYEYRFAGGDRDALTAYAEEMVALEPAAIVTGGTSSVLALTAATSTIPIVVAFADPATFDETVQNFERPEGNLTGIPSPVYEGAGEVDFALELVPEANRIGYLARALSPHLDAEKQAVTEAARSHGASAVFGEVTAPDDVAESFERVAAEGVDVVIVPGGREFRVALADLTKSAAAAGVPAIYAQPEAVETGGLISQSVDQEAHYRMAAEMVDKILRGTAVADLPILESAPMVVRLDTELAEELGLGIPESILSRAEIVGR